MANQYTTVQRINDLIQRKNYIASISYNQKKACFRLVYRHHSTKDFLMYVGAVNYPERGIWMDSSSGSADYNKQPAEFQAYHLESFTTRPMTNISALIYMMHVLENTCMKYERKAYNVSGL